MAGLTSPGFREEHWPQELVAAVGPARMSPGVVRPPGSARRPITTSSIAVIDQIVAGYDFLGSCDRRHEYWMGLKSQDTMGGGRPTSLSKKSLDTFSHLLLFPGASRHTLEN